jgi:glyoxylase-like metal-dependent hydrolase (beta-lactamase superfamily II)
MTDQGTSTMAPEVEPAALYQRLLDGEGAFLLDVRAAPEYEEWRIEAANVETVHHPYFDLLDGITAELDEALPSDRTITVLCGKGGSSELVAEHLRAAGYDAEHLADGMKGWARVYRRSELLVAGSLRAFQYHRPSSGSLAYLFVDGEEAAVVDPLRAFTERYVADAAELGAELRYALDTHIHADHVSGIRELADKTGATPVLPAAAAARGVEYDIDYETVVDGETLEIGDTVVEAVHTPGHTTGMTAYTAAELLLTGDGLFLESVARPDLEDPKAARDAARTLYDSLHERVLRRDGDTLVAPAHVGDAAEPSADGYTARLAALVARLDAFSLDRDAFVDTVVEGMPPQPANFETIIATNLGEQDTDAEAAFELELGPNNCAAN